MSTGTLIAVIVPVAVVLWMLSRRRHLQDRFGPEYERTVEQEGGRPAAPKVHATTEELTARRGGLPALVRAVRQVRAEAAAAGHRIREEIRAGRDPALRTVLAEDSTACTGVLLAMAGTGLHMATGQMAYEASASILIGVLLVYVAYTLGKGARARLIGEAADPEVQRAVNELLQQQPEIDSVTSLLTMRLGPDSVLLAASVDLTAGYDSETVEDAMVRIRAELQGRRPELDRVFLDVTDAAAARRAAGRDRGPARA